MPYYIPERPLEPPTPEVFCECAQCGDDITDGEECYSINGAYIHADCLDAYFRDFLTTADCAQKKYDCFAD